MKMGAHMKTVIGLLAAGLLLLVMGVARAEPHWKGAGWYVVADTIVGPFVWTGPYGSKEECEPNRPEDEEDAMYFCEYLNEQPSWDD